MFAHDRQGITTHFEEFEISDEVPPPPPSWINSRKFFGPYVAGVIDGDGNVRIKRPEYPQCYVDITSAPEPKELQVAVEKYLNCSSSYRHKERGNNSWYRLQFLVSSKNIDIVKEFVYPHIQIKHKREAMEKYFDVSENKK